MIFNNKAQLNQVLSSKGRIIAFDVGTKRIGVAISDESRIIATPKQVLLRKSNEKDFGIIKELLEDSKAVVIVLGLPLNREGLESEMSQFVRKFADNLDRFLENRWPIFLQDERYSSFEAREFDASGLSRKSEFYDDIAAAVILESFLQL